MKYAIGIVFALAAWGQEYELGATVGYGFYPRGTIFSASQTIDAGIRNRFAAGITFGEEFSRYVSEEFRYLYHDGHPFLEGAGVKTDIQGQSHALTAEMLFHLRPREERLRPYFIGGAGAKEYVIAGPEPFPQPIPQVATLTTNDVWKVVLNVGAGVQYRAGRHVYLRAEFLDYMTTFPRQQIVPAPHNTARGIFQQLTPLFGMGYIF